MSRTPELNPYQRQVAVKLVRGMMLDHDGSSQALAHAFQKRKYDGPKQVTLSGISHKTVKCGREIAENLADFLDKTYEYFFENPGVIIVHTDLPAWDKALAAAMKSKAGEAYDEAEFFAASYTLVHREPSEAITPKFVLDLVKKIHADMSDKTRTLVNAWMDDDGVRIMPVVDMAQSTSRLRTPPR